MIGTDQGFAVGGSASPPGGAVASISFCEKFPETAWN